MHGRPAEIVVSACYIPIHLIADAKGATDRHQAIHQLDFHRELLHSPCSVCGVRYAM